MTTATVQSERLDDQSPRLAAGDPVDQVVEQWRRERPDLDASPIALFGRVHRVHLRVQSVLGRAFEEFDLNAASFDVLAALRRAGAPYRKSGSELAADSLLSSAGMTLRLDRLEQSGLIERHRDTADRRVVHSQLTEAGLRVIEEAIAVHLDNEHQMLAGLSRDEQTELARLLGKLEASVQDADVRQPTEGPARRRA
jgi:DNA-binding MarR family transcriptional regulator